MTAFSFSLLIHTLHAYMQCLSNMHMIIWLIMMMFDEIVI